MDSEDQRDSLYGELISHLKGMCVTKASNILFSSWFSSSKKILSSAEGVNIICSIGCPGGPDFFGLYFDRG